MTMMSVGGGGCGCKTVDACLSNLVVRDTHIAKHIDTDTHRHTHRITSLYRNYTEREKRRVSPKIAVVQRLLTFVRSLAQWVVGFCVCVCLNVKKCVALPESAS